MSYYYEGIDILKCQLLCQIKTSKYQMPIDLVLDIKVTRNDCQIDASKK